MRILALTLAAWSAATVNWSAPTNAAAIEARLPHISVEEMGKGTPVVLVPGLSTPRAVWDGIAPELARNHRVILVQVNGFAGDEPGANLKSGVLAGIGDDLHSYIAEHHLGRVRFVGHSMGGLVAMMVAADHPADVDSVMVVDALPFAGVMFDEHATVDAIRPLAAMLKTKLSAGYAGSDGTAAAAATAKGLTAKPASAARVEKWILAADPKVAAEAMAEDLTTDLRPKIESIVAPITLLHPAAALGKDEKATDNFYRAQFTGAKHVTVVAVPESGHFIMLDQPKAFAEAVEQFLK